MRAAGLALAAALLAGCGAEPQGDEWFPLAAGHAWRYRTTLERDGADPAVFATAIATRGAETVAGERAWRRHVDSGTDYWLRADAAGIVRVAARGPLQREAKPDPPGRFVLKAPYAVGTTWQTTTTTYVLQRSNEVPKDLSRSHPALPMSWRIEATGERVQTPAGRFDGCLRVQGRAEIRLFDDSTRSYRPVPLTSTEWYCPGVGLVRLERVEPSPSKLVIGGRLLMELAEWH